MEIGLLAPLIALAISGKIDGESNRLPFPVAPPEHLCHPSRMSLRHLAWPTLFALAACSTKVERLAADDCWSLRVGDRVAGTAMLSADASSDCVECGAYVSGGGCPHTAHKLVVDDDTARSALAAILRSRPDPSGAITTRVYLTGTVVASDTSGSPYIQVKELRTLP